MLLFYAEITFAFVGQQCAFSTNSFQFNVPTIGQLFSKCHFDQKGQKYCKPFCPESFYGFLGASSRLLVGFFINYITY